MSEEKPEPVYLRFLRNDGSVSDAIPLKKELEIASVVKYETKTEKTKTE